jgi:hypothetical protein
MQESPELDFHVPDTICSHCLVFAENDRRSIFLSGNCAIGLRLTVLIRLHAMQTFASEHSLPSFLFNFVPPIDASSAYDSGSTRQIVSSTVVLDKLDRRVQIEKSPDRTTSSTIPSWFCTS